MRFFKFVLSELTSLQIFKSTSCLVCKLTSPQFDRPQVGLSSNHPDTIFAAISFFMHNTDTHSSQRSSLYTRDGLLSLLLPSTLDLYTVTVKQNYKYEQISKHFIY